MHSAVGDSKLQVKLSEDPLVNHVPRFSMNCIAAVLQGEVHPLLTLAWLRYVCFDLLDSLRWPAPAVAIVELYFSIALELVYYTVHCWYFNVELVGDLPLRPVSLSKQMYNQLSLFQSQHLVDANSSEDKRLLLLLITRCFGRFCKQFAKALDLLLACFSQYFHL